MAVYRAISFSHSVRGRGRRIEKSESGSSHKSSTKYLSGGGGGGGGGNGDHLWKKQLSAVDSFPF